MELDDREFCVPALHPACLSRLRSYTVLREGAKFPGPTRHQAGSAPYVALCPNL